MDEPISTGLRRPRRDSVLKRKAILGAAKKLFLQEGYANTSMDAISIKSGVSKRTVYGHFGTKDALFEEIIRGLCNAIIPKGIADASGDDTDVEDRLTEIGITFLKGIYAEEHVQLFRTVSADSRHHPMVGRLMYEGPITASHTSIKSYFDRMVEQGRLDLDDTEMAAGQYLSMIKTNVHMQLLLNFRKSVPDDEILALSKSCSQLFLNGAKSRS